MTKINFLITQALTKIKETINNDQCLLVIKGLPPTHLIYFLKNINGTTLSPEIHTNGKINLSWLAEHKTDVLARLLTAQEKIICINFEELLLIAPILDLKIVKRKIVILENNLFKEYPYWGNIPFINIEEMSEQELLNKPEGIFQNVYSHSYKWDDMEFISYRNLELPDGSVTIPFFTKKADMDDSLLKNTKNSALTIRYPESTEFFTLKNDLCKGEILLQDITLLFNSGILNDPEEALNIALLVNVLNQFGVYVSIVENKAKEENNECRKEFKEILNKFWKSEDFRDLTFYKDPDVGANKYILSQAAIIEEVVIQSELAQSGDSPRDIFLTAPTGAGKSVMFQIPAKYLADKYQLITVVISPLKALMYDQVSALQKKGVTESVFINSDISLIEREGIIKSIKDGQKSILYLSPELFLSYDIRTFIGDRKLGLLVIDEAHLVTTWGRDFRVDYWYLGTHIRKVRKYSDYDFPLFALTATAVYSGKNDIVFETINSLGMRTPEIFIGNVRREEIDFSFKSFSYTGSHELNKLQKTKEFIMEAVESKKKTIVYFPWINQIRDVRNDLGALYNNTVGMYFGSVDKYHKQIVVENFHNNKMPVVLATKAFGMGVDISNITQVYHHAPSGGLTDYIQEVGRLARQKGLRGLAAVDFCDLDLKFTRILYGLSALKQYQIKAILEKLWLLYQQKGKQNFLISCENFEYIFNEKDENVESKVKSALLLLEKDLLKKFKYNLVVVRPKNIFSNVFICVPESIETMFLQKYGAFCRKLATAKENCFVVGGGRIAPDDGSIFELYLDRVWENFYSKESFPMIKKNFFEGALFFQYGSQKPTHRYSLNIKLKNNKNKTLELMEEYLNTLANVIRPLEGRFFRRSDLEERLAKINDHNAIHKRLADLFNYFCNSVSLSSAGAFVQVKKDEEGNDQYRILELGQFESIKSKLRRTFNDMFINSETEFIKYIPSGVGVHYIDVAFVLEGLLLGTYELIGGQLPRIFVRVNDPYRLKRVVENNNYSNDILDDVERRHKESMDTMEWFFTSKLSLKERWDFIENYFLGRLDK